MMARFHFRVLMAALTAILIGFAVHPASAKDPVYTSTFSSLAVSGYDPVAYFTEGKPVEGRSEFEYEWMGATWRFASKEHLETFKADPEAFAPQYGGYCAWAVSQGYTASSDPEAWRIVDGKLYLNYSFDIQQRWEKDIPGFIQSANANWPKVIE
jgi:YHS domain-containing protein